MSYEPVFYCKKCNNREDLCTCKVESLRQQLAAALASPTIEACVQMIEAQAVKENAELHQQLAEAKLLRDSAEDLCKAMRGTQAEADFGFQMMMLEDALKLTEPKT